MANLEVVANAVSKTLRRHKGKFQTFFQGWYGWEKWFQVELAYELADKGEAYVEKQCTYDKKKKLPVGKLLNSNAFIDIIFRKHNDTKGYFSAIELTVGRTKQSLRKVLSDLLKIKAIKKKDWFFRSVFVVLVFDRNYEKNTKFSKLYDRIKSEFQAKSIDLGDFSFLVFGWEPQNLINNMNDGNYAAWVESLVEIYKDFDIYPQISSKKTLAKMKVDK